MTKTGKINETEACWLSIIEDILEVGSMTVADDVSVGLFFICSSIGDKFRHEWNDVDRVTFMHVVELLPKESKRSLLEEIDIRYPELTDDILDYTSNLEKNIQETRDDISDDQMYLL